MEHAFIVKRNNFTTIMFLKAYEPWFVSYTHLVSDHGKIFPRISFNQGIQSRLANNE